MPILHQRIRETGAVAQPALDVELPLPPPDSAAASPLFDGLAEAEVREVLDAFDTQSFNAGHRVTLEGFHGRDFYVIVQGRAGVSVGSERVAELGPGDFFGEAAVLSDGLRSATVTAETPLRCLVLTDDALERLLIAHPRVGINLLREVLARFAGSEPRRRARVRAS